jgi:hypothetical protein
MPLEATSVQERFVGGFKKWVFMAKQPQTSLRSPRTMPSVCWSGVKLAAFGLWSSGNKFSGVMNHASVRRTNLGLADARRMTVFAVHTCKKYILGLEVSFRVIVRG